VIVSEEISSKLCLITQTSLTVPLELDHANAANVGDVVTKETDDKLVTLLILGHVRGFPYLN
jgi:hypothetical protein